jgi:Ca-activated chloride channel family protein
MIRLKQTIQFLLVLGFCSQLLFSATPRVWFSSPQNDDIWIGKKQIEVKFRDIDLKKIRSVELYLDGKLVKEFKAPPYLLNYDFGQIPKNRSLKVLVKDLHRIVILEKEINSYQFDDARIVDVAQVVVPVVVTDQNGYYIKDLNRDDFVITEDGTDQPITYFDKKGKTKFNLVLLMDISSSMKDKIGDVKDAAKIFMEALITKNDKAIIVMFNHEVFEDTDFTNNIDELINSLSIAFPFGATALYDAIAYCIKLLKGIPGRNIIILFSDGEDNSSYIDPYTLIKRVEQSNSVIYSIGKRTAFFDDIRYQDILKNISVSSGGITFLFDDVSDLPTIYRQIRRDIRAKYILQFKPRKRGKLKRFRKISVSVKGKRRYKIRTIKGYYY